MNRARLALAVALAPTLAFSQEKVTSGLQQATNWASGIVATVGVLALMYAAVQKMWGDPTANQKLGGVVIGGILGLGAAGLMQLLQTWFR
jgi:hypothetical protein